MQVIITINCDNAAFATTNPLEILGEEVVSVLNRLAKKINYIELAIGDSFGVNDSNGNKVAILEVIE